LTKSILLIGQGKLLYFLCRTFVSKGYTPTIISRDRDECVELARKLNVTVVQGDGSDPEVLEDARVREADAVVAVTPYDEDNLATCQLASLRFAVPRTVALVNDPDNETVFTKLGVAAISTTRVVSSLIEQMTTYDEITHLLPLGEGKITISEVVLKEDSPVIDKTLRELSLPENCLLACIMRFGEPIVPHGGTVLRPSDKVILITSAENHGAAVKAITGGDN